MDFDLFRDLERLRQTGNFSQAAALGNVSQPAFSRRIKALEAWVGVALVNRARQPVHLTEAGERMLEAGLQSLARVEQERSQILEAQSLPDKYIVTFAAQHSIGWRFYPSWLQALEEGFGPILSRLRADDLPSCMADLKNGEVDFVIAYQRKDAPQSEKLGSIAIGSDQLIPVCKPDGEGQPLFRFDAPGIQMPFLRFGETAPIGQHIEPLLIEKGLKPRLKVVYENSMAGALRVRARAGDGVAWLPRSLVAPDLENRFLVQTGNPDWSVDLDIRMMRDARYTNRVSRSIWSYLEVRDGVSLV